MLAVLLAVVLVTEAKSVPTLSPAPSAAASPPAFRTLDVGAARDTTPARPGTLTPSLSVSPFG